MLIKAAILTSLLLFSFPAAAQSETPLDVILDSPVFPPESDPADCEQLVSVYQAPAGTVMFHEDGPLTISDPTLRCFELIEREQIDPDTERQTFSALLDAYVVYSHPEGWATFQGTMETITYGTGPADGLSFEIVSMHFNTNFAGFPLDICECPVRQSLGSFSAIDQGDGLYSIQSSFDLHIELCGDYVLPEQTPLHMDLISVDEPMPINTVNSWGLLKSLYR